MRVVVFAWLIAAGCGRIGFDPSGDGGSDGGVASVFTPIALPPGGHVSALARTPSGTLYAVLANTRVVRSDSNGALWTACAPTGNGYIQRLAVDPVTGALYLAGSPDVLRTTDGCASWSATLLSQYTESVAVLGAKVFASAPDHVWVQSGGTWSPMATPLDGGTIRSVAVDPTGNRVFATGDLGIARSLDGGQTWNLANTGLPGGGVYYVVLDPVDSQRAIALADPSNQRWYLSTNGGTTWADDFYGGFAIAFDPSSPSFVVASPYIYGVTTSSDAGATFGTTDLRSPAMARAGVLSLAFDASSGIYAATGRGMFYAPDHALAWREIDAGIAGWEVDSILAAADGALYLATYSGVLHSDDAGVTWQDGSAGIINDSQTVAVAAIPGATDSVMVASINSIARSDDRGNSFTTVYTANLGDQYQLGSLTIAGTKLIAGTGGGVVTADSPWTSFSFHALGGATRFVQAVLALDAGATQILAGSESGIFYSGDSGASFTDISAGLGDMNIRAIAQLPDGTLLAGTAYTGVFRASSPTGPWAQSGLGGLNVQALLATQGRVIAATGSGVFVSSDGATWQVVPGLEKLAPRSLAIDRTGQLLVGTASNGLHRTPLP